LPLHQMGNGRLANQMRSIASELDEAARLFTLLVTDCTLVDMIEQVATVCVHALQQGNRIIFAGNGGSAADAQHLAAELVGRFYYERRALPSLALNTDTSMLTSIGNDYGFNHVFTRQLEANGRSGDVFIAMSTSGMSANIIHAIRHCKTAGVVSIGLSGGSGGEMGDLCDYCLIVPSESTPRIQEAHILIGHSICAEIERRMFPQGQH